MALVKHHGNTWVRESMHSDFGLVCRQGCPESPQWDGVLELDSAEKERDTNTREQCRRSAGESENLENHPKLMIDCALWILARDFLSSVDDLFVVLGSVSLPTAKDANSRDLSWVKKKDHVVCRRNNTYNTEDTIHVQ